MRTEGLPIAREVFADTDTSGGKMSRPAFDRALAGVREGKYGGIAVYHLSRFGRNTQGVLDLIYEFEQRQAVFACLTPKIETATPEGRAMHTVFLAFYTLEREQAVSKQEDLAALKLSENECLGGKPPVGYVFEVKGYTTPRREGEEPKPIYGWLVPDPETAPTVAEALVAFAAGKLLTAGAVADYLNAAGVTTSYGKRWNAQNARKLLLREAYAGVRVYAGSRIPGAHEGLITPEQHRDQGAPDTSHRGEAQPRAR